MWLTRWGKRRGVQTSEFLVLVLVFVGNTATAAAHLISSGQAVKWTTIAAIAYKIGRSLVKSGGAEENPVTPPPIRS